MDAGEFLGNFATNFGGVLVLHKIGDLGVKYGLEDGSIPKAFLHGVASGSLSSINGGEFVIGAASGALGEAEKQLIKLREYLPGSKA